MRHPSIALEQYQRQGLRPDLVMGEVQPPEFIERDDILRVECRALVRLGVIPHDESGQRFTIMIERHERRGRSFLSFSARGEALVPGVVFQIKC